MSNRRRRARHDVNSSPAQLRKARRRRRARRGIVAGAVVGSLAITGVALAATRDPGPQYRTATASTGAVEQTIEAVGTVASASRADASFSVAGTVGTVDVSVGDVVAAGDVLATLDLTELQDALEEAESAVADAEQQLEDDLEAQTSTSTSSSTTSTTTPSTTTPSTTTPSTGTPGGSTSDPATAAAVAAVSAAQRELLAQYDVSTAALATSRTSLEASQAACEAFTLLADSATTEALDACQDALDLVLAAQVVVEAAQATLLDLSTALDRAVTEAQRALAAAASSSASSSSTAAPSSSSSSSSTAAPSSSSSTSTQSTASPTSGAPSAESTSVPSAEDILADRAAIEEAEALVEIAQASLGMSTLTSPISGTVGAVSIVPGDAVTASSTTAVVTVLGDTGHTVTMTIALSVIETVAVGQSAEITVASTDEVLTGEVLSIGILDVSESSTPSYTVVVTLDPTDELLFEGSSAQVTITVSGNEATLTVPTSAVHVEGGATTVTMLSDGEPVEVEVEVGAVGDELTEILSGLEEGDEVVLADLSEPLTEEESTTSTGLSGLGDDTSGASDIGAEFGGGMMPSFDGGGG